MTVRGGEAMAAKRTAAQGVRSEMNSTPFVRQYGKLVTNGVLFYAKRGS